MGAPSCSPCPLQHSCWDFCRALMGVRKPYAEVLPSLLVGSFLPVGKCKFSPNCRCWIFACVHWEIQSNVWCFRVMEQKISSMCLLFMLHSNNLCLTVFYHWGVHAFNYFSLLFPFLLYWLWIYFGCLHLIMLDERDEWMYIHPCRGTDSSDIYLEYGRYGDRSWRILKDCSKKHASVFCWSDLLQTLKKKKIIVPSSVPNQAVPVVCSEVVWLYPLLLHP